MLKCVCVLGWVHLQEILKNFPTLNQCQIALKNICLLTVFFENLIVGCCGTRGTGIEWVNSVININYQFECNYKSVCVCNLRFRDPVHPSFYEVWKKTTHITGALIALTCGWEGVG